MEEKETEAELEKNILTANEYPGSNQKLEKSNRIEDETEVHEISLGDFVFAVIPIALYIYDVWSDIAVSCIYYVGSWWTEFTLTTLFLVLPSVVTALFRLRGNQMHNDEISTASKILDFVASVFCLMPLLASLEYLWYSANTYFRRRRIPWPWSPNKLDDKKQYAERVTWIMSSLAIMRLIESFIEAIPQITLQLYITLAQLHDPNGPFKGEVSWRVIQSLVTSVASCSWSICSAYLTFTYGSSLIAKKKTPYARLILMFIAYAALICTRFFSLQYLLINFPLVFLIFCLIHWLISLVWIYLDNYFKPISTEQKSQKFTLARFLGNLMRAFSFIVVFSYIFPKRFESNIWMPYALMFFENLVINVICFLFGTHFSEHISNEILSVDALCLVLVPQIVFSVGFALLVWQNGLELTMDAEDEIEHGERMTVINKMLVRIMGITLENVNKLEVSKI